MSILDKDIRYVRTSNGISMEEKIFDELVYRIHQLEKENERLKENNSDMQEEMARTWQKCDDYKSRCEKAIEYIENQTSLFDKCYFSGFKDLLNILQNGSDDNE